MEEHFGKNHAIIGQVKLYSQEIIMILMENMQLKNLIKQNLKELVTFVQNRRKISDVICLLGNHDSVYFNGNGKCRFDYWQQKEVKELISSLNPQLYYIYEDLTLKEPHKYLFSHAGITKDWLDYNNLEVDTINMALVSGMIQKIFNCKLHIRIIIKYLDTLGEVELNL